MKPLGAAAAPDLDRSIPVLVRREDPLPVGPPPQVAQAFVLILAVAAGLAAVLVLLSQANKALAGPVVWAYALLALAGLLCWRAPLAWMGRALTALMVAGVAVMGLAALRLGWGLSTPAFSMLPLMVCVLGVAAGWRAGAALAVMAAATVLALGWMMKTPALPPGWPSPTLLLSAHLVSITAGAAAGAILARLLQRALQSAHKRERRFRRLLSLATDAYWEIDGHYRLVAAGQHDHEVRSLGSHSGLGAVPWELPRFGCDADTLDLLQADLGSRAPFRDLPFTWRNRDGSQRAYLASGEPRFDALGLFKGYWGVARDVTAIQTARAQLQATESRYEELFARIPTPLVLHRHGRVIDANAAGLALFGYPSLESMLGVDMFASFDTESRARARGRAEQLSAMAEGAALPVASFQIQVHGKLLTVQGTGVSVSAQGGPALLAIFMDVSERLAAEEAVRRSETMLAHLVATSPDLITLTEVSSGRYAMVNQAFERVTGWTAAEAVGHTSMDLGIWGTQAARDNFDGRLREQGSVVDLPVNFVNKAGVEVAMRVSAAPFVMDRRDYVVINARDVSAGERARLEREAILDNASIGIAVTRQRCFVLVNPHFERIFGWPAGELIGQSGAVVWPSPTDYQDLGQRVGPALGLGEAVEFERAARRKDGSIFTVLMRARAIDPTRPLDGGTAWIAEDVTERRQFEQALARARDDAEAANRAKSAFLANTSHELRTPLNGMIGLARLACGHGLGDEQRQRYLDQIAQTAQSLAAIISDILDLSKIEAGKLLLDSAPFDLGELLRTLAHTYQTLALAKGLQLLVDLDSAVQGAVSGDALRVRQLVTNFLSNAIKFTSQGQVRLHATRTTGGVVRIEITDTGLGIAAEKLPHLFKPFMQADQSTTRRYGGTGLGLSICRELALLMGGEVGVDSQPGQGSRFWVALPLAPSHAPLPAAPAPAQGSLAGLRVLMVEDNAVNMMIAVAMLEGWGVTVTQALDGHEALATVQRSALSSEPFHAVLMDVQMPGMSGHEATRALRLTEAGRQLPIIALTAAALVSEREEALAAGMDDFLTKPIDADKLHATIARWGRPVVAPA